MPTPLECFKHTIARWEGEYQAMAGDPGNWVGGRLVGTVRGVTPAVLAAHRGIPVSAATEATMRSVTLQEAAEIGLRRFYRGTGLDKLAWGPATDAVVDFGWGAGPGQACKTIQRTIGATPDGVIGPLSIAAYDAWIKRLGWAGAVDAFCWNRQAFYDQICATKPTLQQFRAGWSNRAKWMTTHSPEWWGTWKDDPAVMAA